MATYKDVLGIQPATAEAEPPSSEYNVPKTKAEANKIVGGLSAPGKMPEGSFGLSAHDCKTGSALRQIPGSVCSTCYAHKGMYVMPNTKKAHDARKEILEEAMQDSDKRKDWVGAFTKLMEGKKHFRWHDSGDIQSPEHLGMIADVARATPNTKHWLPTKEPRFVKRYEASGGVIPDNLIVRVSAPMNDQEIMGGFNHTASVHKNLPPPEGAYVCPASQQGGKCDGTKEGGINCRACWNKDVSKVSYPWH
jgi:hypothetical protein